MNLPLKLASKVEWTVFDASTRLPSRHYSVLYDRSSSCFDPSRGPFHAFELHLVPQGKPPKECKLLLSVKARSRPTLELSDDQLAVLEFLGEDTTAAMLDFEGSTCFLLGVCSDAFVVTSTAKEADAQKGMRDSGLRRSLTRTALQFPARFPPFS
jgi:hypothetical protein